MSEKRITALYAGSFDPVTFGHLDILSAGLKMFDKVIIAVANNSLKKCLLSVEKRVELIKEVTENMENAEVVSFKGLTADYAKERGASVLIRGVRSLSDFENEISISHINRTLCEDIQTVFIASKPEYEFISSSAVKDIIFNGGDVSKFVPKTVAKYLKSISENC